MKKINIAITINIIEPEESLFTNGIKQNTIILRDCLLRSELVNEVYYINFGHQKDISKSPWKAYEQWIMHDFKESLGKIDLYINAAVFMNEPEINAAREHGAKVINQVMGNEYYGFLENVLFKNNNSSIIRKIKGLDAAWISPHLYENNKALFEVLYDAPAYVAPYIWSPQFLMGHIDRFRKNEQIEGYKPSGIPQKRISTFEPSIGMNKTAIFPMIIAEKFHDRYPDEVERFNMFGTFHVKDKKPFLSFALDLNVNRAKKMFFEARYPIAWSLLKHTDILLSHQQDCDLNYLYFDAAWIGYPIVHNATRIKELGWYYPGFDDEKAVKQLHEVIQIFDTVPGYYEEYLKTSREYISQFLPEHDRNVTGYTELIRLLFKDTLLFKDK
ncbi:DUF2827 family protein [bacterium]|nr:DUF2827 family protein [Candidatus Elulimicrobium humile]